MRMLKSQLRFSTLASEIIFGLLCSLMLPTIGTSQDQPLQEQTVEEKTEEKQPAETEPSKKLETPTPSETEKPAVEKPDSEQKPDTPSVDTQCKHKRYQNEQF